MAGPLAIGAVASGRPPAAEVRSVDVRLPIGESEAPLDELWDCAIRGKELTWQTQWRRGNLVLCDNRCTMRRREPFDLAARRVVHRTQIHQGEALPAAFAG
jgi:taurine dioxygenase